MLNRSGVVIVLRAGFIDACAAAPAELEAPSFAGSGLFRISLSAVLEDDGVTAGDCPASRELDCGEDVPSFDSPFLDFDLFGSFVRESCSC